jgi:hypothetical protein
MGSGTVYNQKSTGKSSKTIFDMLPIMAIA